MLLYPKYQILNSIGMYLGCPYLQGQIIAGWIPIPDIWPWGLGIAVSPSWHSWSGGTRYFQRREWLGAVAVLAPAVSWARELRLRKNHQDVFENKTWTRHPDILYTSLTFNFERRKSSCAVPSQMSTTGWNPSMADRFFSIALISSSLFCIWKFKNRSLPQQ